MAGATNPSHFPLLQCWKRLAPGLSALVMTLLLALAPTSAYSEAPLETEGAETESEGTYELEAQFVIEEGVRGFEVGAGYVPVDNIEMEVEFEAGIDTDEDPSSRQAEAEFSIKWVPEQTGIGVSYGFQFAIGREREDDRQGETEYGTERSLVMLMGYEVQSGPKVHVNFGAGHESEGGESEYAIIYAVGLEQRIARRFTVTAEVYGEANERATQALGLRYKFSGDTSLFARIGRNGDETFGGIGVAFEFEPD